MIKRAEFLVECLFAICLVISLSCSGKNGNPSKSSATCPIVAPSFATNLRFASYSQDVAHAEYVRFDAPASAAQAWAMGYFKQIGPLTRMDHIEPPVVHWDRKTDLSWFDVNNIKHGLSAGGGSWLPQIWIDLDRNVFYYRLED